MTTEISFMHILGGVVIGLVVGKLFATFSLRKVEGGKYTFMAVGIIGSLLGDALFLVLYEYEIVSEFFYKQTTIIFEMIAGASVACYILHSIGKREQIEL